jgi:glycosyltransferase involved in cell wall biosynthesis
LARPVSVHGLELADHTTDYAWERDSTANGVITLCPGALYETLPFRTVFLRARQELARLGVEVCFLPSYWPKQSLAALLAAKSLRIKTVMMNESHAGTSRATGVAGWVKRRLVGLFDAALVGGAPHKRYFTTMGLPQSRVFTGYDAVDNEFFAGKADEVRSREAETRRQWGLPGRYFLSLGRFVAKKNLATLIRAYRLFLETNPQSDIHLVLVGSGETESEIAKLAADYELPIHARKGAARAAAPSASSTAGVHLYGFRQIDENPVFYALAEAFILPSLYEEWGLVVSEAMASGLPVIVSETAGCAEDLLEPADPWNKMTPAECALLSHWDLLAKVRENGFVFDPKSSHQLNLIMQWLEANPRCRAAMGKASRRIVEKFSCEKFAVNALLAANAALMQRRPQETGSKSITEPSRA